jgi:hypothetical protein
MSIKFSKTFRMSHILNKILNGKSKSRIHGRKRANACHTSFWYPHPQVDHQSYFLSSFSTIVAVVRNINPTHCFIRIAKLTIRGVLFRLFQPSSLLSKTSTKQHRNHPTSISAMENLRTGGAFVNRREFTKTLNSWCVGSFGTRSAAKFLSKRTTGEMVEYECKNCDDTMSTVHTRLHIHRLTANGKKIAIDRPVTIEEWNPCDCEIVAPSHIVPLPPVGQIFESRKEFTASVKQHCLSSRKIMFTRKDSGNKAFRNCTKEGCPGRAVVKFTYFKKEGGGHLWVPPLTVTESTNCGVGCEEVSGELSALCHICNYQKPISAFVTGTCCQTREGSCCLPCFEGWLKQRPLHHNMWTGNENLFRNKMVRLGKETTEVWPRCPVNRCEFDRETTFIYRATTHRVADVVPHGFDRRIPIYEKAVFDTKFEEMKVIESNQPAATEAGETDLENEDAIEQTLQGFLREPGATNEEKVFLLTQQGFRDYNAAQAKEHLIENGCWDLNENMDVIDIV